MTESESIAFIRVREIVAECAAISPARISTSSDLYADLGISGDDGDDLFEAFDDAFEVDWTGLDLAVHFGNEGFGIPFPWQLKNNCVMYEPQPCRISDIVRAVETGRWPGTRLIRRPKSKRTQLYLLSILQTAVLLVLLGAGIAGLLN